MSNPEIDQLKENVDALRLNIKERQVQIDALWELVLPLQKYAEEHPEITCDMSKMEFVLSRAKVYDEIRESQHRYENGDIFKMDSETMIGKCRERIKQLEHKDHHWPSFHSGWLEGRLDLYIKVRPFMRQHERIPSMQEAMEWMVQMGIADFDPPLISCLHEWMLELQKRQEASAVPLPEQDFTKQAEIIYKSINSYANPDEMRGIEKSWIITCIARGLREASQLVYANPTYEQQLIRELNRRQKVWEDSYKSYLRLERKLNLTEEDINKNWKRYSAINHFYEIKPGVDDPDDLSGPLVDAVYQGASAWQQEYDDARKILMELVAIKSVKETEGKTEEYQRRQPEAWKAAIEFLNQYQHVTL